MRLVSFGPWGQEKLGALIGGGERILDLHAADRKIPATMLGFLRGDFWGKARRILDDIPSEAVVPARGVRLGAPVPRPGQIICVGLNYRDHAQETKAEIPTDPILFFA